MDNLCDMLEQYDKKAANVSLSQEDRATMTRLLLPEHCREEVVLSDGELVCLLAVVKEVLSGASLTAAILTAFMFGSRHKGVASPNL